MSKIPMKLKMEVMAKFDSSQLTAHLAPCLLVLSRDLLILVQIHLKSLS